MNERGATLNIAGAGTADEKHTGTRKLPGGGFLTWGIGDIAWVEASLPKRALGHNVEALGLDVALDAAEDLYREALDYVEPDRDREGHRFERCKVLRLDAVRDFEEVKHSGPLLDGLAAVPIDKRLKKRRYQDAKRNRCETLMASNSRRGGVLYDKFQETMGGNGCEPGRLRFEARMRGKHLRSVTARRLVGNVDRVADLTEDKVAALRREMFEAVGFDREVSGVARLADIVEGTELSAAERRSLWAFLTMPAAGADPGFGKEAAAKYRRIAGDLGVTVQASSVEVPEVTVALDYDRGREVLRVA